MGNSQKQRAAGNALVKHRTDEGGRMSQAGAKARRPPRVPPTTTKKGPRKPQLRVSQIIVQLVLLDEHDAPAHLIENGQPRTFVFAGNADGTAAENLKAWADNLPAFLALVGAQMLTADDVNQPTES